MKPFLEILGFMASCVLPLFNIPLIYKMIKRKSSKDLSFIWLWGVWTCFVLMLPAAVMSPDMIFRVFGILNVIFFTTVLAVAVKYR